MIPLNPSPEDAVAVGKAPLYEWVRTGMASVTDQSPTIPWCEREYFVTKTDYDALIAERDELVTDRDQWIDVCREAEDKCDALMKALGEALAMWELDNPNATHGPRWVISARSTLKSCAGKEGGV